MREPDQAMYMALLLQSSNGDKLKAVNSLYKLEPIAQTSMLRYVCDSNLKVRPDFIGCIDPEYLQSRVPNSSDRIKWLHQLCQIQRLVSIISAYCDQIKEASQELVGVTHTQDKIYQMIDRFHGLIPLEVKTN